MKLDECQSRASKKNKKKDNTASHDELPKFDDMSGMGAGMDRPMTAQQVNMKKQDFEKEFYGRKWILEGYFNEKNREIWTDTAEKL